jgi:hypothetical protein
LQPPSARGATPRITRPIPRLAQPVPVVQEYSQPHQQPQAPPQYAPSNGRGLFNAQHAPAQPEYAQPSPQQFFVLQYYHYPPLAVDGSYAAAPTDYAYAPPAHQQA